MFLQIAQLCAVPPYRMGHDILNTKCWCNLSQIFSMHVYAIGLGEMLPAAAASRMACELYTGCTSKAYTTL
jgi:hypothetical protein